LKYLNKGIDLDEVREAARLTRQAGLGLSIYLITGVESENDRDLDSTLQLIDEIRPHDGVVSRLTVYPGTALHGSAARRIGLDDAYWVRSRSEAFYVRDDPWTHRSLRRLRRALRRVGRAAAYGPDDFDAQRRVVGDCHALRLAVGEYHAGRGRCALAEAEYRALLADDPRSLWARMRLGALALRRGRHALAAEHYRAAAGLVPAFHLSHALLGEALLALRRRDAARESFARALALRPGDAELRRRVRQLSGGPRFRPAVRMAAAGPHGGAVDALGGMPIG
jgi:tetratricopeptide (TPR) repeat protein